MVSKPLRAASLNHAAPTFSLSNAHHQTRKLAQFKGNVVLINFWASWCAPCQQELPELDRLAAEYAGKRVHVVAINEDRNGHEARKILNKLGLTAPHLEILWDVQSRVVSTYNIQAMPTSFILDGNGTIRYIHAGYHDQDPKRWRQEIDSLL